MIPQGQLKRIVFLWLITTINLVIKDTLTDYGETSYLVKVEKKLKIRTQFKIISLQSHWNSAVSLQNTVL